MFRPGKNRKLAVGFGLILLLAVVIGAGAHRKCSAKEGGGGIMSLSRCLPTFFPS